MTEDLRITESAGTPLIFFRSLSVDGEGYMYTWARDAIYLPPHKPPVADAKLGRDGTVWLRGPDAPDGGAAWTCLDRSGSMLGRVLLPTNFQLMAVDRHHAWGQALDELDVPSLVRFSFSTPAT